MPRGILPQRYLRTGRTAHIVIAVCTGIELQGLRAAEVSCADLHPLYVVNTVHRRIHGNKGVAAGSGKGIEVVSVAVLFADIGNEVLPVFPHTGVHGVVAVKIPQEGGCVCGILCRRQQQLLHDIGAVDGHNIAQVPVGLTGDGDGPGGDKAVRVRHAAGGPGGQHRADGGHVGGVAGKLRAQVVVGVFQRALQRHGAPGRGGGKGDHVAAGLAAGGEIEGVAHIGAQGVGVIPGGNGGLALGRNGDGVELAGNGLVYVGIGEVGPVAHHGARLAQESGGGGDVAVSVLHVLGDELGELVGLDADNDLVVLILEHRLDDNVLIVQAAVLRAGNIERAVIVKDGMGLLVLGVLGVELIKQLHARCGVQAVGSAIQGDLVYLDRVAHVELLPVRGLDLPGLMGRQRIGGAADGHGDGEVVGVAQSDGGVNVVKLGLDIHPGIVGVAVVHGAVRVLVVWDLPQHSLEGIRMLPAHGVDVVLSQVVQNGGVGGVVALGQGHDLIAVGVHPVQSLHVAVQIHVVAGGGGNGKAVAHVEHRHLVCAYDGGIGGGGRTDRGALAVLCQEGQIVGGTQTHLEGPQDRRNAIDIHRVAVIAGALVVDRDPVGGAAIPGVEFPLRGVEIHDLLAKAPGGLEAVVVISFSRRLTMLIPC